MECVNSDKPKGFVKDKEKTTVVVNIGCTLKIGVDTLRVMRELKKIKEDNVEK